MEDPELTRGEQTRQEILDAAKGLFLAQGYTATSMRQIARAVGITPAAIYNHFPGKDEIFTSLLQQEAPYDRLFALTGEMEADTPEGLLRQLVRGGIELVATHRDYMRLALIDAQEREGATLAGFLPRILPQAQALYERLVALDAGQGRLREVPFLVFTGGVELTAWSLLIVSLSSYLAMNFTGSSTYTSLSGVKKEMKGAVPFQITAASAALICWLAALFTSWGGGP